jgi:isopentenyldiphosphate isomerase
MNSEELEIFDDNYKSIGKMASTEVHLTGQWHHVFHCWLLDSGTGAIIYQRRSRKKKLYPNMLDVSVAGHCRFEETIAEAIVRESAEELGIKIIVDELLFIGIRRDAYTRDNFVNREYQHVFIGWMRDSIDSLLLDCNEVEEVVSIEPGVVIDILTKDIKCYAFGKNSNGKCGPSLITKSDFIPSIDKYNLKIPKIFKLFLDGERELIL